MIQEGMQALAYFCAFKRYSLLFFINNIAHFHFPKIQFQTTAITFHDTRFIFCSRLVYTIVKDLKLLFKYPLKVNLHTPSKILLNFSHVALKNPSKWIFQDHFIRPRATLLYDVTRDDKWYQITKSSHFHSWGTASLPLPPLVEEKTKKPQIWKVA